MNTPEDNNPRVILRRESNVGIMVMNRSQGMNAMDVPMLHALDEARAELEADPQVHVVVITGADDRTFMAGGDIADLNSRRGIAHYREFATLVHGVVRKFEEMRKPTIAAVNGWALGGGCEFMLALDLRVMSEDAKLGLPEVCHGIIPGGGGTQRLMRQIPLCQAKMMVFTGDFVSADEALAMGLVNKVVPQSELMAEALKLAHKLASRSTWALEMAKASMVHGAEMPLSAALAHEAATSSLSFQSDDAHEGFSAFLEKRRPTFKGY